MDKKLKISMFGLGKLGLPIAACYASKGFQVIGVEVDFKRVEAVNKKNAPIFEPGIQELLNACGDKLTATSDALKAVRDSDISFVIVPTPSSSSGKFSNEFVLKVCDQIGAVLKEKKSYHLVVINCTVMPGSMEGIIKPHLERVSGKKVSKDFGLCYNPEFVALGDVIGGFKNPPFVLIGESDEYAGDLLSKINLSVMENNPPFARMNFDNAEFTKLVYNVFSTLRVSFANMLAGICEKLPRTDVDVITKALCLNPQFGNSILTGATSYGGPCWPRDNIAVASLARQIGAAADISEVVDSFNRFQNERLKQLVLSNLPKGGKVGILGLTYKPNTDVIEEATGIYLAKGLVENNTPVISYDPHGIPQARQVLKDKITFADNVKECIEKADLVVVTTPWKEFVELSSEVWARKDKPRIVIDCWRVLKHLKASKGINYLCLGIYQDLEKVLSYK